MSLNPATSITELKLPATLAHYLRGFGYATAGALAAASDGELLKVPGMGRTKLIQVREALGQDTRHLKRPAPLRLKNLSPAEQRLIAAYRAVAPPDKSLVARFATALCKVTAPPTP
jgi:Bacterial RNA polymerase, alpha chain C terminal domain